MARKKKHEEHLNHEAWAIPYGDLVTLLLAFFVVMYSMSSVNEGKYRILSDSLVAAFRGSAKSMEPIQIGSKSRGSGQEAIQALTPRAVIALPESVGPQKPMDVETDEDGATEDKNGFGDSQEAIALERMRTEVETAMQDLIETGQVSVRRKKLWLEVEIKTDILFASGEAGVSDIAVSTLEDLAGILSDFKNPIRVEGHTDNVPIRNVVYPSNWELSAARAASVVHILMKHGVDPLRLEVTGFGENRPISDNATEIGRNENRRVLLVVLQDFNVPTELFAVPENPTSDTHADASGVAEASGGEPQE